MQPPRKGGYTFIGPWRRWFAWWPVPLLGTPRTVWLCWVFHRKAVRLNLPAHSEYTDTPERHPIGPHAPDHWL
jgi:hypothetical protein